MANTIPGLSRFRQGTILSQHRLEEILLASLTRYPEVEIQRRVIPDDLMYQPCKAGENDSYPIKVMLRYIDNEQPGVSSLYPKPSQSKLVPNGHQNVGYDPQINQLEQKRAESTATQKHINGSSWNKEGNQIVKARYMIGCDGAHSWTRSHLGIEMHGEQTDFVWGVLDIIPITNFPDIRSRCAIHSAKSGSIMLIPREGKLIRIYCQLNEITSGQGCRFDRSKITEQTIFHTAQEIMKPYTLGYKYCDNWTVYQVCHRIHCSSFQYTHLYQIGQRVGERFSIDNRIFLAGDAVHTHSPKAGQGMNVSMQDSYNLGWKLALVLKGFADPSLLSTYEQERRAVALELIAFDQQFSKLFSSRPAKDTTDNAGLSMDVFKEAFIKQKLFSSGFAVDYGPNVVVAKEQSLTTKSLDGTPSRHSKQHLAFKTPLGKRFPNVKVLNHSDARPWDFAKWLKSNGLFRIILFAGNVTKKDQMQRVRSFCSALEDSTSFFKRPLRNGLLVSSFVEILTIHSAPREDIELVDFPELLHPFSEMDGWDYDKIFVDGEGYYEPHGEAYKKLGVDEERGCVVVARPDQHVGWIGELEDVEALGRYFEGFLAM